MTGNKIEELLMELLQKVSSIDALLTSSQSILRDHEHRIDVLERHPSNQNDYKSFDNKKDNEMNDIINIIAPGDRKIGIGRSAYSSREASSLIGQHDVKPIVHYDYLYIEMA